MTQNGKTVSLSNGQLHGLSLTLIALLLTVTVAVVNKEFGTDITTQQIIDNAKALQTQLADFNSSIQSINDSLVKDLDAYFYANQKECSYLIAYATPYYTLQNGTTSSLDYWNTNVTKVETFANGNLSTGGLIETKEVLWNTSIVLLDNVFVIQNYNGTYSMFSNAGAFGIPVLNADPSTALLTLKYPSGGNMWYNNGQDTMKYWNGTAIVIFPSIGGGSSSSYVLPVDYTVYQKSSIYYAEKSDGSILSSSTNATAVINNAMGNLTVGRFSAQTVQLTGNITLSGCALLIPKYCILQGPATLVCPASFGDSFIRLADPTDTTETYVKMVDIEGTGQSSGCGINFTLNRAVSLSYTDWGSQRTVTVENCKVRDCASYGIYINDTGPGSGGPVNVHNVWTHQDGNYGLYIDNCTDSEVSYVYGAGAYLRHCTSGIVTNMYMGNFGGHDSFTLDNCQRMRVSDVKLDSFSYNGFVLSGGCRSLNINNVEVKIGSQLAANNTYYGIYVSSATYCLFNNVGVHQTSGTNKVINCIYEAAGSNYNNYGVMTLEDSISSRFRTLGTGTQYDSAIIIGSIATS